MTILAQYHCNNCGENFEVEILERSEKQEYERQNRPTYQIHCPKCNRTDIVKGGR